MIVFSETRTFTIAAWQYENTHTHSSPVVSSGIIAGESVGDGTVAGGEAGVVAIAPRRIASDAGVDAAMPRSSDVVSFVVDAEREASSTRRRWTTRPRTDAPDARRPKRGKFTDGGD
jgi:hypothetical protein